LVLGIKEGDQLYADAIHYAGKFVTLTAAIVRLRTLKFKHL
jgi:hypothetical protein